MWELFLIFVFTYVVGTSALWTLAAILSWCQGETVSVREHEIAAKLEETQKALRKLLPFVNVKTGPAMNRLRRAQEVLEVE